MKLVMSSLLVAVASSSLVAAAPAPAQAGPVPAKAEAASSERLDLARRFMAMTNTADTLEQIREAALQSAAMFADDLDDSEKAAAQQRVERYLALAEPKIRAAMPALIEANAQANAREFSADELRQLIAFYQTPGGKHYIDRYDFLQLAPEVIAAQRELGEQLQPVIEDFRKQMCAEKAAQRIAMGDKNAKCPLSEPDTQAG